MEKHAVITNKGILGRPDSVKLWTEILSHPTIFKACVNSKYILVMCGGHGTEVDVLVKLHGEKILTKIVFNDKHFCFTNSLARKYPSLNIVRGDFMITKFNKKFGVIVGNPPYQDPAGQNTLYPKFYSRCVELLEPNGHLAMITPPAIIPGLWGLKDPDGIKMPAPIKIDLIKTGQMLKDHFPGVSSEFCYFILENTTSANDQVPIVTDAGQGVSSGPIIPKETNNIVMAQSILNKCFSFYADYYKVSSSDHGKKAYHDLNGVDVAVESISTAGELKTRTITWKVKDHPHYNKPKVLMPMYGKVSVIDYTHNMVSAAQEKTATGKLTGHNVMTVITKSNAESEVLVTILESRLQRFFNSVTSETRSPYVNFLKNFKGVPLNRSYTDVELEATLGLTQQETDWLSATY